MPRIIPLQFCWVESFSRTIRAQTHEDSKEIGHNRRVQTIFIFAINPMTPSLKGDPMIQRPQPDIRQIHVDRNGEGAAAK